MKKIICFLLGVLIFCGCCLNGMPTVQAESGYLSSQDAVTFLAFVYNSSTEKVTQSSLANDIYYKMLTGQYSGNKTYELAAKAAFLSFLDARLEETLTKANQAVKSSSDYLIEYFSKEAEDEVTGMVTGIFKENVGKSLVSLCGGEEEVLDLAENLTDAAENPSGYLEKVKAISATLTYAYGQNVLSLYTYFDAALSCVYLKTTEGAYETAMSYNIMALRESNFMAFAAKLIPGITSWEEWVSEMDAWAEYVSDLRSQVVSGQTGKSYVVAFDPNCEGMDVKVNWYASGELKGPEMEREGYIFQGWYFDKACTDGPVQNGYVVTENLVLYAKWEPRYFKITFDSNCSEVADYSYDLDRLNVNWHEPDMTRPGYLFLGWYWDSACTNPVEGSFTVDRDMTFYAGWELLYAYTVSDGKATLYGVRKWETDENGNRITDMKIPSIVGGYPVAFVDVDDWNLAITGVTFPDTVEKILEWSFSYCQKLTKVMMGNGITEIEEGAFNRCDALETVVFGNGLQTIGEEAFSNCSSLKELQLPESLKTIARNAFIGCGLTSVQLPDSVATVEAYAFRSCDNLKTVTVGKNVSVLSGDSFESCESLAEIVVSAENQYFASEDGVLYNKDKTVLYKYPPAKTQTSFTIPDSVEVISANAFSDCVFLREIKMRKNVKTIEERAFYNCGSLQTLSLPDELESIAKNTFYGCSQLTGIVLPDSVKSIGSSAFYDCSSLCEIVFPEGLTLIDWDAFSGCSSLKKITIPDSVETISEFAFYGCSSLEEVRLPSGLTRLETCLFGNCTSLETILLPETVTAFGYGTFSYCSALKEIQLPKALTDLGSGVFTNCTKLEKIRIPDGIPAIYYDTFYGCESLKQIVIPNSVTLIDGGNFCTSPNLKHVYYLGSQADWANIEIGEYGNENLDTATIYYNCPIIADFGEFAWEGNTLGGKLRYDRLTENCDLLVGLYEGDRLVATDSIPVTTDKTESEISFSANPQKSYQIKAFFWNLSAVFPKRTSLAEDILAE